VFVVKIIDAANKRGSGRVYYSFRSESYDSNLVLSALSRNLTIPPITRDISGIILIYCKSYNNKKGDENEKKTYAFDYCFICL
jgi:hypothetical protein